MSGSDIHSVTVQLSKEIHEQLDQLSESRGLKRDEIVKEALEWFLEQEDGANRAAVDAWNHYKETGLHVTNDEIGAWVAELEAGNDNAEPPACHV